MRLEKIDSCIPMSSELLTRMELLIILRQVIYMSLLCRNDTVKCILFASFWFANSNIDLTGVLFAYEIGIEK